MNRREFVASAATVAATSAYSTLAKGGGLQIGVGPSAHSEFHPEAIRQMRGAGTWLKVNGEAIYATRPRRGTLWSEGETVRYTRSKDSRFVHAILTDWPGTQVVLKTVQPKADSKGESIRLAKRACMECRSTRGTIITLPENLQQARNRPCRCAWSLKLQVAGA
jgi:alpha-L-fucosidase